jgi:hypothetical protein
MNMKSRTACFAVVGVMSFAGATVSAGGALSTALLPDPWPNAATKLMTPTTAKHAVLDFIFINPTPSRIRSAGLVVCQTRGLSDNTAGLGTSPSPALRLRSNFKRQHRRATRSARQGRFPRSLCYSQNGNPAQNNSLSGETKPPLSRPSLPGYTLREDKPMKLGLGLYRHMLTPENFRFAKQAGSTTLAAASRSPKPTAQRIGASATTAGSCGAMKNCAT